MSISKKYRAFCERPANDRGVYVEAVSHDEAARKIREVVSILYGARIDDVEIYNLESEDESPKGVLNMETGWAGGKAIAHDENPLVLYR